MAVELDPWQTIVNVHWGGGLPPFLWIRHRWHARQNNVVPSSSCYFVDPVNTVGNTPTHDPTQFTFHRRIFGLEYVSINTVDGGGVWFFMERIRQVKLNPFDSFALSSVDDINGRTAVAAVSGTESLVAPPTGTRTGDTSYLVNLDNLKANWGHDAELLGTKIGFVLQRGQGTFFTYDHELHAALYDENNFSIVPHDHSGEKLVTPDTPVKEAEMKSWSVFHNTGVNQWNGKANWEVQVAPTTGDLTLFRTAAPYNVA